jgi:hypothetical protein
VGPLWTVVATLALVSPPASDQVVVATAPPIDAQRLADALRVYLNEYGIRVEARGGGDAPELSNRLEEARKLGQSVRAVAVVRAAPGTAGEVEIELVDLATDKALLVSVPRPPRDEDLYRALALKIQSVLRATLSEARLGLDPRSSLGRLVAEGSGLPRESAAPGAGTWLALDAGYGLAWFPLGGPLFGGLAVRATWRPAPRVELALATAALGPRNAVRGTVEATATMVPVHLAAKLPLAMGRAELLVGPCLAANHLRVATASATRQVRSSRTIMFAAGVEAEGRLAITAGVWLFTRAAALGVINGEVYDVDGAPIFDTSRLQISGSIGAGVGLR